MKTQVEFRSSKFPAYEGEEKETNPGIWGKRLAEFLQKKLAEQGFSTQEIYSEDWGWVVPIKNDAFPFWVGCGHQADEMDGFLCFIEPSRPVIRKWFKKIDATSQISQLTDALDKILSSDSEIKAVRWSEA